MDHRVCNNLEKKNWKIWCCFEITCHIRVLLSSETREAGLLVVQCEEGQTYYWIGDGTSSNMAVKMYGVFQSCSQGPLSSSLARILMENWIFFEVLELHAPQSFKIVTNKVCWSLTEMSVGDKRTAEAMRGPVVEFLLRDHNDSETRWENEHEVSGQHQRKEHDKLDLNSRMWWRVTWDTECMEISRTGSSTREYQLIFACSIDVRLKPITTSSHALSRAWGSLLVFTLNLIGSERYFSYLLIGLCNNFGFGFTSLNPKAPHFKRVFFLVGLIIP